jgi:DNA polymerase I-like protein with 3'-5' exonuclease and polymerase domains
LRADGQPYASGQIIVPSLPEWFGDAELLRPSSYDEVCLLAEWEPVSENPNMQPWSKWRRFLDYALADAVDALELKKLYQSRMERLPWSSDVDYWRGHYLRTDAPSTRVICEMERMGMYFDKETAQEMLTVAEKDCVELEGQAVVWAGFPLRAEKKISAKRLEMLLHGVGQQPIFRGSSKKHVDFYIRGLELPIMRETDGGSAGTSTDDLKKLRAWAKATKCPTDVSGLDPLIRLSKVEWHKGCLEGLIEKVDSQGRVRGRINQIGTTSGRYSMSNPINLQNITTGDKDLYHIRDCFQAPPGNTLIVADFSQLEYRLLAHFSREEKLIALFHQGWDLHSMTTYNIFPKVKFETDQRFGGFTLEAGLWIAEEFSDLRKRAKCVHPDTLITTEKGYTCIGAVVGEGREGTFTKPGTLEVEGPLGMMPLNCTYRGGEMELVAVVSRHNAIVCTKKHKFRLANGRMVPAGDLAQGDELEEAPANPLVEWDRAPVAVDLWPGVPVMQMQVSETLAYFAGVFHGDGSNNETSAVITHGPVGRELYSDWQDTLVSVCEEIGFQPARREKGVYFGSRVVVRLLEGLGLSQPGGKRKLMSVPAWAMNAQLFPHYLAGLIDTDGCVGKDGRISITTKWPTYAGQLATLVRAAGAQCSIEPTYNRTYNRYYYRVFLSKDTGHRLVGHLLKLKHKRERVAKAARVWAPRSNIVLKVIPQGVGPCVDLNLRGHVYYANGLVTHNTLNFEIIYGVGHRKLAEQLEIPEDQAKSMIDGWFAGYPRVKQWQNRELTLARERGYGRTLAGRYRRPILRKLNHNCQPGCPLRNPEHPDWRCGSAGEEERTFLNGLIQGSAMDMTKRAMIRLRENEQLRLWGYKMLVSVHDEVVAQCRIGPHKEAVALVKQIMENLFDRPLRVPMPVSVGYGPSWASAKV